MDNPVDHGVLSASSRVYVAGHRGMVGSAIVRRLREFGCHIITRTHKELDLTDQAAVETFFASQEIDYVVLAAAKVGGILANNTYPAEFIYMNIMMEANVINSAYRHGVNRLLFLGSSCIYPKMAEQPMKESALLTGPLEPTNEPYALAKIAGIKLCESYNRQYGTHYRSVMPTNLYGPNDNFELNNSHVLPALIRKFHEAKENGADEVVVWGTGKPRREFLHVDDLADACVFVMALDDGVYESSTEPMLSHINIGTGVDISIADLAGIVRETVGFEGEIVFDTGKPDGTPRKLLDVGKLSSLGWKARIGLREGIRATYRHYLDCRRGAWR
jgi:nucleoside-diphosphate-sugar epimerase